MESHEQGDATEAAVIANLKQRAIPVSIPFGDNQRYDVVIETPRSELLRIQIKTGWLNDGKITFHGASQHTNSAGNTYKKYEGDVEYFIIYTPEIDGFHAVAEHEFDSRIQLRVPDPEQADSSINWAESYEFGRRWPLEAHPD